MNSVAAVAPRRQTDPGHQHAVSQEEANAIAASFDIRRVDFLLVYWVQGRGGVQALLQPVPSEPDDWEH